MLRFATPFAIFLLAGCSSTQAAPAAAPAATVTITAPAPTATVTARPKPAPTVTKTVTKTEVKTVTKAVTPRSCRTALQQADNMRALADQFAQMHGQYSRVAAQTAAAQGNDGVLAEGIGRLNLLDEQMASVGERARAAVAAFRAARTECLGH